MLSLLAIVGSTLQAADNYRGVAAMLVAPELVKCIAACVVYSLGTRSLADAYTGMAIVFAGASLAPLAFPYFWGRSPSSSRRWYHLLISGSPYAIAGLLFMVYYRAPVVVFSALNMLDEAGSIAIIYLFMTAILLLPTTYSQRFLLGRWHAIREDSPHLFRAELAKQMRRILAFTLPIAIIWFFAAPFVLDLVYGTRYPLAHEWAPWFSLVFILRSVSIPLQSATSISRLKWPKTFAILSAALGTIVLSAALATQIGFTSAFISAVSAEVILSGGLIAILWYYLKSAPPASRE